VIPDMEVRGYRWRYSVYFGVMFAVGSQLASLFRHGRFDPADLVVIACLTLFSAVFGSSKGLHLRIVSEVFSGPPRRGFQRVHMRVADIDRQRSAKPGFLGAWTVWSRTGEAIYIDPVTVPKPGRLEILRALGLIDSVDSRPMSPP
jgi:hypothetical protein